MRTGAEQSCVCARKDLLLIRGEARRSPLERPAPRGIRYSVVSSGVAAGGGASACAQPAHKGTAGLCSDLRVRASKRGRG